MAAVRQAKEQDTRNSRAVQSYCHEDIGYVTFYLSDTLLLINWIREVGKHSVMARDKILFNTKAAVPLFCFEAVWGHVFSISSLP